ncbi:MAG: DbpA RNA binding domain-containing protein, partial [Dysgonamonadaceae bacterium]|nr:DbpA RNA binding domain-containing protein [Dysgonamonadaceae bacterium]
ADLLIKDGYNADSLHGDLSQQQRDYVMNKFRIRHLQLLVATDVAARGLDVDDLTHIINYGLPDDIESYTHRSGRTGRAGKTGTSISIIHLKEKHKVRLLEKTLNRPFEQGNIPTGAQICEKQLFSLVDRIEKVKVNEEEIAGILPSIYRKLEWLDKEDILKRVISLEFNRLIDYYQEAGDIESPQEYSDKKGRFKKGERGERGEKNNKSDRGDRDSYSRESGTGRNAEKGYARLFINLGKTDGINPATLIGVINDHVRGRITVGRIDLMKNFSFFEVREQDARTVVNALNSGNYNGRRISVEIAQDKPSEFREKAIKKSKEKKKTGSRYRK